MDKQALAAEINSVGDMISKQQEQNSKLTEQLLGALEHGLDLPTLQEALSVGVSKVILLGEKQNELIKQWFEA